MQNIWPLDTEYSSMHSEKEHGLELARAYVLCQKFEDIYGPLDALKRGTAFEKLDMPKYCRLP